MLRRIKETLEFQLQDMPVLVRMAQAFLQLCRVELARYDLACTTRVCLDALME